MKKSILFLVAIAFAKIASAQTISVTEGKAVFSVGEQDAITTTIYQNSKDDVVSKWKSYLKDFKNEKVTIKVALKANPKINKEFTMFIKKKPDDEKLRTSEEILGDIKKIKTK